jgi:dihydrofolate reductase
MKIILIAAKSDNNVLGYQGDLPWHLPGDLAFFEAQIKTGFLLTGRTSYASPQGQEVFANRSDLVVVTRQKDFKIEHGFVAHDIEAAFALAKSKGVERLLVLGGAEIYAQTIHLADELIITEVHGTFQGDSFFPAIDPQEWKEISRTNFPADAVNAFAYSFVRFEKR